MLHLFLLVFSYLFLLSPTNGKSQWQRIQEKGYLTWVTRPSPLTYYNGLDGIIGLEYDILKTFCETHNLELNVIQAESNGELFKLLRNNNIDIAGANLTLTQERSEKYFATHGYDETFISLVSSLGEPKIKSIDALENYDGAVLNNSSYQEVAQHLIVNNQAKINSIQGKSLYELLQMVLEGKIDFTLADANAVSIYQTYMPMLRVGLKLTQMHELVFLVDKKHNDDSLKIKLDDYINYYKSNNKVDNYKQFITSNLPNSKPADTLQFLKNYLKRWPLIKPMIYSIAEKYEVSPILLGAISYQESHWNAQAVSPTLVKGLMMLTKAVASEYDVTDRFDPKQSLDGGTQYFFKMKNKIPDRIVEPDRTNFALAAYNLGYGHLEKARVMTQKAGKNPDLWIDVKQFLPLLNQMKGFRADGKTAVRYVENIRAYENLLQWKEQQ